MSRPRRIVLVRHGESEGNADDSVYEREPDHALRLTRNGREQAAAVGERLRELFGDETISAYVSPYRRTLQTFRELGGSSGWASMVDNHKPAHTKSNAVLKAEVIRQAAEMLKSLDIATRSGLHQEYAQDESLHRLKKAWLKLPSQSSGITFNYLLIRMSR